MTDHDIKCPKCGSTNLGWIEHPPVDSERQCMDCDWKEWS